MGLALQAVCAAGCHSWSYRCPKHLRWGRCWNNSLKLLLGSEPWKSMEIHGMRKILKCMILRGRTTRLFLSILVRCSTNTPCPRLGPSELSASATAAHAHILREREREMIYIYIYICVCVYYIILYLYVCVGIQ